ncbi:MAG: hypothetical protein COB16_11620 [Rhodobacteraceae bacterium]|nr:MAG: hypothetical protein COB16_11620 [Paracoccaceae bacterium]
MAQPVSPELAALAALRDCSLCWQPEYLTPSAAVPILPLLFWLSEVLQPQVTVSLGGQEGVAHLALCQAAARLALDTRCLVQLEGPDPVRFHDARQAYSSDRSGPVLVGGDGFSAVSAAVLTVHLGRCPTQAIGWMPWLQHLPPRGAAVFYGAGTAEMERLEPVCPAGGTLLRLGLPDAPVLLALGSDMPKRVTELLGSTELQESFNGFLMGLGARLQQRVCRHLILSPDPTAPLLPVPQNLEEARAQITRLIEMQAEDLDCLAQHLQDQEKLATQRQLQQRAALAVEQAEVARQRNIVARLEAGVADLYVDTEGLRQDVHDSSTTLDALRNSSSWRLTAPLRQLMRMLRG